MIEIEWPVTRRSWDARGAGELAAREYTVELRDGLRRKGRNPLRASNVEANIVFTLTVQTILQTNRQASKSIEEAKMIPRGKWQR